MLENIKSSSLKEESGLRRPAVISDIPPGIGIPDYSSSAIILLKSSLAGVVYKLQKSLVSFAI